MNEKQDSICVVHLVRNSNGINPFKAFVNSYKQFDSGYEHDLIILLKGFDKNIIPDVYQEILTNVNYKSFFVSDEGLDITAYSKAFLHYKKDYNYYCFLNSYSIILDDLWLKKLYDTVKQKNVGLVGATGSWASNNKSSIIWFSNVLKKIFLGKKIKESQSVNHESSKIFNNNNLLKKILIFIKALIINLRFYLDYDRYPNYHIRTNAFIISSVLLSTIKIPNIQNKMDAYKFESGKKSLTKQVLNQNKAVFIVGKNGVFYKKEDWNKSNIFWQNNQENLLISDNQTRDYEKGDNNRKEYLNYTAWL